MTCSPGGISDASEIRANDFDEGPRRRDKGEAVQEQIRLDDLNSFITRHLASDGNVHLTLDEVVHDDALSGELFVKAEHVLHIAVWKLQFHQVLARRGLAGRRLSARSGRRRRRCGERLNLRDTT